MGASGDRLLLEELRRHDGMTVQECMGALEVTATAVRSRLNRLMEQGLVERVQRNGARGRPRHEYFLTPAGQTMLGQNYADLARTMWQELKAHEDRALGMVVLRRVADRMAESYRHQVPGHSVSERLLGLERLLRDRGIDVEVDQSKELPVLRQYSCPYYELAATDRTICGIEKRIIEKTLNTNMKLSRCRLDGHACCEFEVRR